MKRLKTWAAALGLLTVATATHAAPIVSVDGGLGMLVSATGLAWTAYMNLNERMTWAHANPWIGTLNASNGAGHND